MKLKSEIEGYISYNEQEQKDKELMIKFIDTFEDVLTRKNEFGHFTASSWIVNRERTKVLMIYHNIYDSWTWTGGHADGDEDLLYVAIKEAKEETGIKNISPINKDIFSIEILSVDGHIKRGEYVGTHLHYNVTYLLEANEDEELVIRPDENSGVKWVDINEAIEISREPKMRVVFKKLNEKLKEVKLC